MSRRMREARRNPPQRDLARIRRRWLAETADGLSIEWSITPTTAWVGGITDASQITAVSFGFDRGEPLTRRQRIVRRARAAHSLLVDAWEWIKG